MKDAAPKKILLSEYKKPDYTITDVHLTFDLHNTKTIVSTVLKVRAGKENEEGRPLILNGEEITFLSAKIDGSEVEGSRIEVSDELLTIKDVPQEFTLEIKNEVNPEANKALDGLYKSGSIFCTQNEPEGFRRITYYLDRPDVMAKFTTKIIADKKDFPILLSNGNPIGSGDLDDGKHWMEWEDPFVKPAYLYALVAGDLGLVQDTYKTMSGREIDLRIYVDKGNEDKCDHAMESLKKSMEWDEDTFGLEYDLDIYMIVAVDSFNMGAMENKGLNIFNSAYVLAKPETATDHNYYGIEAVIGHEYFHNWSGNRVTCRDWFQLTLKEGLTVFRDQEFSADMNSRGVKRIDDVEMLRANQFAEDGGPQSHPIKPESYIEINNFYTLTIYEKGAEVIRMFQTLLGKEGFRRGIDKYFELFDGQAVTTEDFIHAMSIANDNFDFTQFKNWYSQSGTPVLDIDGQYDEQAKKYTLKIKQSCPATPGQESKELYHIPLNLGLVGLDGNDVKSGMLELKKEEEIFEFEGISSNVVPSLNRDFSAPVRVNSNLTDNDLAFLMGSDSNEFNRFESGVIFGKKVLHSIINDIKNGNEPTVDPRFIESYGKIVKDDSLDNEYKSMLLNSIPTAEIIHQEQDELLIQETYDARKFLIKTLVMNFKEELLAIYNKLDVVKDYKFTPRDMGERSLKAVTLSLLMKLAKDDESIEELCFSQFKSSTNMTDEISALKNLIFNDGKYAKQASDMFYGKWKDETLVVQKWLSTHSSNPSSNVLARISELEGDEVYDKTVPNLVRSLLSPFGRNLTQFHTPEGYKFIADKIIELDSINPQVASRLTQSFNSLDKMPADKKSLMKAELDRIIAVKDLSKNVFEIASNIRGE